MPERLVVVGRPATRSRAIVFDLDDTLYPYRAFVRSGFRAVGLRLAAERGLPARSVLRVLRRALVGGERGRELQALCFRFSLPPTLVPLLAAVIRDHTPSLRLPRQSVQVLAALRESWSVGVLTNGSPPIQRRKVEALGLETLVDAVIFATEYGDGAGKPEAPAFHAALDRLAARPEAAVFVGDDRRADIDGAAAVGMSVIHLLGRHPSATACDAKTCGIHIREIAQVPDLADRLVPRRTEPHAL